MNNHELKKHAVHIRQHIIRMVSSAKSGHPGGSLSGADILSVLYFEEMNIQDDNVNDYRRDRFILSKGHASPLLYAALYEKGLLQEDLSSFRQINSKLQGHPNMNYIAGIDMSTGSLGQGLSCAVGMALANKLENNDYRVYTLLGDGECEEGQIWEAVMAAAHYKLDNLCAILDYNGLQIDGDITKVMNPEPFDKKFEAFHWNVMTIDGHDYDAIRGAFQKARQCMGKPTLIIAKTMKGKGISFMENNPSWHGSAPNEEQTKQALAELEVQINE